MIAPVSKPVSAVEGIQDNKLWLDAVMENFLTSLQPQISVSSPTNLRLDFLFFLALLSHISSVFAFLPPTIPFYS